MPSNDPFGEVSAAVARAREQATGTPPDLSSSELLVLCEALIGAGLHLATDARDWSIDRTDARLYAVLCGWDSGRKDDGVWDELVARHGWAPEYVEVLRRRRAVVARFTGDVS